MIDGFPDYKRYDDYTRHLREIGDYRATLVERWSSRGSFLHDAIIRRVEDFTVEETIPRRWSQTTRIDFERHDEKRVRVTYHDVLASCFVRAPFLTPLDLDTSLSRFSPVAHSVDADVMVPTMDGFRHEILLHHGALVVVCGSFTLDSNWPGNSTG